MKFFGTVSSILVVSVVFVSAREARADMGSVWVEGVTTGSVTLNWSDPGVNHRLAATSPEPGYKVSWRDVASETLIDELSISGSSSMRSGT